MPLGYFEGVPGPVEVVIFLVLGVLLVIVLIAVAGVVVFAFKGKKPGTACGRQNTKLQPCPDCGREVSRRAASCPGCGCPLS